VLPENWSGNAADILVSMVKEDFSEELAFKL
jgi:hypothetical protein